MFSYKFRIEANTTQITPSEYRLTIYKCVITKTLIYFPWGQAGLVGVQVCYQDSQLIPFDRGEFLIGNRRLYEINEPYNIFAEPFELILRGYNDDDTFWHAPEFAFEVTSYEDASLLQRFISVLKGG